MIPFHLLLLVSCCVYYTMKGGKNPPGILEVFSSIYVSGYIAKVFQNSLKFFRL